uniref:non-specific serine/threonine protein kinase n=1 Tax=Astyanax mexicanus TaxID=7994 RepID=A0A8B9LSI3_ASTMX
MESADNRKSSTNRRRTTSNSRHRRDTYSEESPCLHEVLHFSNSAVGEVLVHRGKCIGESERLGRSVYHALNATSGEFAVVYEWILRWSKKIGKFFTSQETEKIEKCKKQIHGAESELNSLLKLQHPNLVHYQALSCTEREDCLVVNLLAEYVPGCSLAHSLSTSTPVPVDELRHHATQLLSALDYLHSNSVVHKQLGASSVLLDSQGNVRLMDYSLAKRLAEVCREDVFEQAHVRFSEDTLPTRTGKKGDIWSLGLLILALSQGREVHEYPVTVPSGLPADLQDFLKKCVCLNDAERWTTQQLLDHSFLRPPSPKSLPPCQEPSPEDLGVDFASTVIPRAHLLGGTFCTVVPKQFSRYFSEFEELQLLGKGAFGAVIKVQNKLDGCYYAVKRIQVNPGSKQFRRIKGEVTLLSRLNHENIVRYYNAWIERHETPSTGVLSSDSSEPPSTPERPPARRRVNELGLLDNVEDDAPPPALASSVEWSTSLERSSSAKCKTADSSDDDDDDDDDDDEEADVFCPSFLDSESDIIFDNGDASKDSVVQMEYCEKSTLRDTIDQGLHRDCSRLWRLFREILDGIAYIHEQGMIHRDLKPVNIFLDSHDHVKIGDFGLATDHPASEKLEIDDNNSALVLKSDPTGNMTGMVGTALYVSPEVQGNTKATYNQKVDLFSLGIILFEMSYRPMATASERITVLSQLRKESIDFPEDFGDYESGAQKKVICWLLNHDPARRPTAVELLKSDLLPPPQMEESELHEVLQHTMANVMGKAYPTVSVSVSNSAEISQQIYRSIGCCLICSVKDLPPGLIVTQLGPSLFSTTQSEKLTKREVEAKFCNLSLSNNSLQTLYKFIEQKGELQELVPLINSLTKQKTAVVTQLAKQGLKDLEELTGLLKKLGVKLQVVVNLGLVYKVQHHCGVIFQFVAFIKKRKRTVPDIVAAGGRYDHLIVQFRAPAATAPVPSAVGASIALDKICTAVAAMEEPPLISSCDVLVVPVGHTSLGRAITATKKLWTAGVSADLVYDLSQSQETLMEQCRLAGITFMVLVSDKEGSYFKVKTFEKDRQLEKRIPDSELVDHIIQKLISSRTKLSEERGREISEGTSLQNPKGSLLVNSGSSEQHGGSAAMSMNVNLVTPDKVSASTRRRYETQVCTAAFEQFNISVKHLLSRLPKQRYLKSICEEIHRFKMIKRYVFLWHVYLA